VAALYDAEAAKLLLYGRALGLSHGEAEDVLQDVFATLLNVTSPPEKLTHYLIRAYRNRSFNHRRAWWRRLTREVQAAHWFEPTDPVSPTETAAIRCLAGLPAEQREVIVLHLWHGQTFEEISVLQAVSPNTTAGRYRYGLQKLRTSLPSFFHDDPHENHTESGQLPDGFAFAAAPVASPGNS